MTYTCPADKCTPDDIVGCGAIFDSEPDHEGLVDCPVCGMWFSPETERKETKPC